MESNTTGVAEIAAQGIDVLDKVTIVFSFITMIIVMYQWYRSTKQKSQIDIYFIVEGGDRYLLKLPIERKDVTRAEIQGVLSVFQKVPSERYSIAYLSDIQFLENLYEIQQGKRDELTIYLTGKEFNGYHEEKKHHSGFNQEKMIRQ